MPIVSGCALVWSLEYSATSPFFPMLNYARINSATVTSPLTTIIVERRLHPRFFDADPPPRGEGKRRKKERKKNEPLVFLRYVVG